MSDSDRSLPPGSGPPGDAQPPGGYRVVARRYRPQRFCELVGQEHVARGLAGAIVSGRVGHAYLFTGGRGVGKTSAARILAKALQCERGPAAEPCDACDACLAIAGGQDIDVVEIDAASNRGIDEIRQLRQNVAVRPARGRYKVYIIDEVHMLTREAFNALLKTLEEPPGHVKFVLCTTEPDKLPVTILSRCQRFDFHVVDAAAIGGRLTQIAAAEGVAITPEAVQLIARRANGSMRDSQSLLEQLLGGAAPSAGAAIGVEEVHAVIGTGREEAIGGMLAAIAARDPRGALAGLDTALAGGADPGGVIEQLLGALRDCLVASVGCGPESLREGPGLRLDLGELGPRLGTATLLAMLQIVDQTLNRMRTSGHAVVLAEMAVVRLATLEDLDALAGLVEQVVQGGGAAPATTPRATPAARSAPAESPREKKTAQVPPDADRARDDERSDRAGAVSPPPSAAGANAVASTPAPGASGGGAGGDEPVTPLPDDTDPLQVWRECGRVVGGLVADFAQFAVRAVWRDGRLEVGMPAESAAAATFLRGSGVTADLQRALAALVGRPAKLAFEVDAPAPVVVPAADAAAEGRLAGAPDKDAPGADDRRASGADDRGAAGADDRRASGADDRRASGADDRRVGQPPRPAPARPAQSQAALIREALSHPLVERARNLFDAAIVKVEPPRPQVEPAPAGVVTGAADIPAPGEVAGRVDDDTEVTDG